MALDENSGGLISEQKAKELIAEFATQFPGEVVSSFIGSANVNIILEQQDCIGLRVYNGYDVVEKKISLVLVGVGANGNDLLADGLIYDEMITCPPICPTGVSLS